MLYCGHTTISMIFRHSLQIQAVNAQGQPTDLPFNPVSSDGQGLSVVGSQFLFNWKTTGLAAGSYQVWVHNGHGGQYGWSSPVTLTVQSPYDYGQLIVKLSDFGALPNTAPTRLWR